MPNIPVSSPLGYIGVFLMVLGIFLVLTGLNIIKIQQVSVTPGKKTWIFGTLLAITGLVSIIMETSGFIAKKIPENTITTPTVETSEYGANLTQIDILENAKTWPLILSSSFDYDDRKWVIGDFKDSWETGEWSILDKKYVLEMKAFKDDAIRVNYPTLSPISDFYMSVDVKLSKGSPNNVKFGLVFRGTENSSFYSFRLEDGPYYRIRIRTNGNWVNLTEKIASSTIKLREVNRLSIIADGYHLLFFINDQYVDEVFDSQINTGNVGLTTTIGNSGDEVTLEFDNFEVREKP